MNKTLAEKVLKAVEKKYAVWIQLTKDDGTTAPDYFPQLVENYGGKPGQYAIVWECGAPDEWALRWGSAKREDPSGTFCEPIYSFVLGIYGG